jgi:predicted transcriptional regulator
MLDQLGRAAREARLGAGLTQITIATTAGVSHAVISRLETAKRWPRDPDQVVSAYERECGLAVDELWRRAIRQAKPTAQR